jgi:hypothetical protein
MYPVLTDYLACYDYGQGGVWVVVSAHSAEAITGRYPELQVASQRPAWLDDSQYERLPRHLLDASPTGVLQTIVEGRSPE